MPYMAKYSKVALRDPTKSSAIIGKRVQCGIVPDLYAPYAVMEGRGHSVSCLLTNLKSRLRFLKSQICVFKKRQIK